jgi:hypothetical protein
VRANHLTDYLTNRKRCIWLPGSITAGYNTMLCRIHVNDPVGTEFIGMSKDNYITNAKFCLINGLHG